MSKRQVQTGPFRDIPPGVTPTNVELSATSDMDRAVDVRLRRERFKLLRSLLIISFGPLLYFDIGSILLVTFRISVPLIGSVDDFGRFLLVRFVITLLHFPPLVGLQYLGKHAIPRRDGKIIR